MRLKVNIEIDKDVKEIEVVIKTDEITPQVNSIVERISAQAPRLLVGYVNERTVVIDEQKVVRFYTGSKKVFAVMEGGEEYTMKMPLYEVAQRLSPNGFVRISSAEVVNIKKMVEFDLSFTGTICVKLADGSSSFVSRRYVSHIKKILGLGGR